MVSIFAVPKSFNDSHIGMIQRNAIRSWLQLPGGPEVILLGKEEGIKEICSEFNIMHIPEVRCTSLGTPLLNSVFESAQRICRNEILTYINCDIILMKDFIESIRRLGNRKKFLLVGRRRDLDVDEVLDFSGPDWEIDLKKRMFRNGKLNCHMAIDYFVFRRDFWGELPPFALGRRAFDNWLLYRAREKGAELIDGTRVINAVHQNHHYGHLPRGRSDVYLGSEGIDNLRLAGGAAHLFSIRDATLVLHADRIKRAPFSLEPLRRYCTVFTEKHSHLALFGKVGNAILTPNRIVGKLRRTFKIGMSSDDKIWRQ